jgi:hypothetical protein
MGWFMAVARLAALANCARPPRVAFFIHVVLVWMHEFPSDFFRMERHEVLVVERAGHLLGNSILDGMAGPDTL